ncbi:4Fe-4S binding protein [Heliobacterium gestii]|uniref:4Fe-4S binding protein n=1 Tax=Heliomicrobium gestii TaxID=2699 RepID=A0A845LGB0_HELGE|nr:4Fe-4S binding protein [Heliomicrobium gestii]MBM7868260.1 polyferredoxin [Heliomicrobium gestii]MZP44454.1 4Fe-4S binding protein [Heliomicrobium gestii]
MKHQSLLHPSRRLTLVRWLSLLFFVGLTSYLGIRHQIVGGGPQGAAPLDTFCVFGGVETLWTYVTTGKFLAKTNMANLVLLAASLVLVIVAGAGFCGWICPLGALQEWLGKLGKRLFGNSLTVPPAIDRSLRSLRFLFLALILYRTVLDNKLWFETYDPFKVIFHFNFETTTSVVILALFIALSLPIERSWCRYLCPLSAVYSLLSPLSLFKLKRRPSACIDCGICTRACPVGIDVQHCGTIPDGQCIKCLQCMEACPKPDALVLETGKPPSAPAVPPALPR